MNLATAALLLLATVVPDRISWMRPDAFHLSVGMTRDDALAALASWHPKPGSQAGEVVVDYTEDKSITLQIEKDRVKSIRFELFVLLPETRQAFDAERRFLTETYGKPRQAGSSVVVYDNVLPNVMVVIADDPKSAQGKKGVGILAVRYYDPR
jgi:hypothetical protein